MPTTVFLSLRGEGASRVLESFRRALGEEAESLVVVPTNDDSGYHGSAEVNDVAAAREAFATARKPFPALKAYIGAGSRDRDETLPRTASPTQAEARPVRQAEPKARPTERPQEARGRAAEPKGRGQDKVREKEAPAEGAESSRRRSPLRHRNRNQRRQTPGEGPAQ
jgi:hypothetical protein